MVSLFNMMMILLVGYLVIMLAVVPPTIGTSRRYRAHYHPRDLQFDPGDDSEQPHTGLLIPSFFRMLRRVYRIEGWAGLYKGLIPMFLTTTLFWVTFCGTNYLIRTHNVAEASAVIVLSYSIVPILFLPLTVIINRTITTPHGLQYFDPMYSLAILLSPAERRRPWILYCTPGLLAAQVTRLAWITFILASILRWVLPELGNPGISFFAKGTAVALLNRVILTPLEVMIVRLSIQRNHGTPEHNLLIPRNDEGISVSAGAGEDVIWLRTDREPYIGLIDCAKKIVNEEHWSALYRAWWLPTF